MIADVNGARINYEVTGSGPPLVLIHGGLVDLRSWSLQLAMADRLTLITPDTRGFGQSTGRIENLTLTDLAEDVAGLLTHLGIDSAYVLGFSMGGMTAQKLALLHPERVRGLILVSTRAGGLPQRPATPGPQEVPGHVNRAFSQAFRDREQDFMQRYIAMATENEAKGWYKVREAMAGAASHDEIGAIRCPTLVIHARNDGSIAVADGEAVHKAIPGSRMEIVEDSGHTMQVEKPELFNDLVSGFVLSCEMAKV
jgi:pimeloyl-ACP methyl ester carboxylesterase